MNPDFTTKLLFWNREHNDRQMPWKGEKDPYRIWLSEVMLQQTRVEQGLVYYHRFVAAFPNVFDLAQAPEQQVFKLWEGLGYYSRCKNLIATARTIVNDYGGNFPVEFDKILALKGIGEYTASAIASFAFNLPYAVLDGNVFRVLARYFGISTPVDTATGRKIYAQLAEALLQKEAPGTYNQAIMDFGAVICKPKTPLCVSCVQREDCQAFLHGWVNTLPVKEKKLVKRTRWFNYFLIESGDYVYVRLRTNKDIWQNLHEFLLIESDEPQIFNPGTAMEMIAPFMTEGPASLKFISDEYRQQLTHQTIIGRFLVIKTEESLKNPQDFLRVKKSDLRSFAFPEIITRFLGQNVVKQQLF